MNLTANLVMYVLCLHYAVRIQRALFSLLITFCSLASIKGQCLGMLLLLYIFHRRLPCKQESTELNRSTVCVHEKITSKNN